MLLHLTGKFTSILLTTKSLSISQLVDPTIHNFIFSLFNKNYSIFAITMSIKYSLNPITFNNIIFTSSGYSSFIISLFSKFIFLKTGDYFILFIKFIWAFIDILYIFFEFSNPYDFIPYCNPAWKTTLPNPEPKSKNISLFVTPKYENILFTVSNSTSP